MKLLKYWLGTCALLLLASSALAHEGHGAVGSAGHDLQHQLWNFAGLILLSALVLGGDHLAALVRKTRGKNERGR